MVLAFICFFHFWARFQAFLNAYDAVVVTDGSFQFVRALIDDILHVPPSARGKVDGEPATRSGVFPAMFGRSLGLFGSSASNNVADTGTTTGGGVGTKYEYFGSLH
jgi:hypothetical protein